MASKRRPSYQPPVREAKEIRPGVWIVSQGASLVAAVEKFPDEPGVQHPYSVFIALGSKSSPRRGAFIGASYSARCPIEACSKVLA